MSDAMVRSQICTPNLNSNTCDGGTTFNASEATSFSLEVVFVGPTATCWKLNLRSKFGNHSIRNLRKGHSAIGPL